jgi:hypothetical protein
LRRKVQPEFAVAALPARKFAGSWMAFFNFEPPRLIDTLPSWQKSRAKRLGPIAV